MLSVKNIDTISRFLTLGLRVLATHARRSLQYSYINQDIVTVLYCYRDIKACFRVKTCVTIIHLSNQYSSV